jgi:hypothetical protein
VRLFAFRFSLFAFRCSVLLRLPSRTRKTEAPKGDPTGPVNSEGGKQGPPGAQKFRLVILDPKTHIKLWALTEFVEAALLQGNRNKNFDKAMDALVSDVKILAAQTAAASPTAP